MYHIHPLINQSRHHLYFLPYIYICLCIINKITRATWNMLPFKNIPTRMIIDMVTGSTMWINILPPTYWISTTISTIPLVTGLQINYKRYFQINSRSYAQTHEEHANGIGYRTIQDIPLWGTGNTQGGRYFFSLSFSIFIHCRRWTKLLMTGELISCVHTLSRRSKSTI